MKQYEMKKGKDYLFQNYRYNWKFFTFQNKV